MIFIFATELEAQHFRTACPEATIMICGVGGAECAASTAQLIEQLRSRKEERTLILAGIAGSYSLENVGLCEVVEVVSEEIASLPERFAVRYEHAARTTLRHVSANSVNNSAEVTATTAQIENMEGAAFMAICQRLKVNHLQIRAISNKVGDPFSKWQVSEACQALSNALCRIFLQGE